MAEKETEKSISLKDILESPQLTEIEKKLSEEIEKLGKEREEYVKKAGEVEEKEVKPAKEIVSKSIENVVQKIREPLPEFPKLLEYPTAPTKPDLSDIWSGFSDLARIIINLAFIATAIRGGGEAYLVAFNNFVDAVRTRKKEDFEEALEEFKTKLEEAKVKNEKTLTEYRELLERAKLGEQRAIDELTTNWYKYQMAISEYDTIQKAINSLDTQATKYFNMLTTLEEKKTQQMLTAYEKEADRQMRLLIAEMNNETRKMIAGMVAAVRSQAQYERSIEGADRLVSNMIGNLIKNSPTDLTPIINKALPKYLENRIKNPNRALQEFIEEINKEIENATAKNALKPNIHNPSVWDKLKKSGSNILKYLAP